MEPGPPNWAMSPRNTRQCQMGGPGVHGSGEAATLAEQRAMSPLRMLELCIPSWAQGEDRVNLLARAALGSLGSS